VQLAANLNGGARRYADIPNLGFWENGNAQFTKQDFSYGDINLRAFPDFEIFGVKDMMDHYWPAARNLFRYPRFNPGPGLSSPPAVVHSVAASVSIIAA